jgi:hypothetical protein
VVEQGQLTRWTRRVAGLVRAASARRVLGGTTYALDVGMAVVATIAAVAAAVEGYLPTAYIVLPRRGSAPGAQLRALHAHFPLHVLPPGSHLPAAHLSAVPSLAMAGVVLTTAPLAFRRTYPATAFCVIVVAVIATSQYSTAVTIAAALFAAYFAIGLRERITIYAGTLDVGPRPGGGWRVRATIPLEQPAAQPAPVSYQSAPA